jgi:hypothetical protein
MKILGIFLLLLGAILVYQGVSRRDSLAGHAATVGTNVANAVDGGNRTPQHVTYIIAGSVMLAMGACFAFRLPSPR